VEVPAGDGGELVLPDEVVAELAALVPKQATWSDELNAVITSLYAKGMSVRDIARHVRPSPA
jgi:hypothetical protein